MQYALRIGLMLAAIAPAMFPATGLARNPAAVLSLSGAARSSFEIGEWYWIPRNDVICRDGSTSGFGVRIFSRDTGVMFYLQGGGACYDKKSCSGNANTSIAGENYSRAKFDRWVASLGNQGIFNSTNATNPVARWNHVFIPYCTGDLHGGTKSAAKIPGVTGAQEFVGYYNVRNILRLAAPFFRNAQDVALVGASAGGIGVLLNYSQVTAAFGNRSVAALVDSAPVIPESKIRTRCFHDKLLRTFGLRIPADCEECRDARRGGVVNFYSYLSRTYPQGRFAMASADADLAGVVLYDAESRACGGSGVNIFNYRFAQYVLRDHYIGRTWATYLPSGIQHTMTQSDYLFLQRKFKGVTAAEWLSKINAEQPTHIPPAKLR